MREIKFRVYDPVSEKYMYPNDLTHGDYSIGVISQEVRGKYGEVFPDFIAEQYTGINDQDGKEIYEGDYLEIIITKSVTHKGVVIYDYGAFCLKRKSNLGKDKYDITPLTNYASRCIILKINNDESK